MPLQRVPRLITPVFLLGVAVAALMPAAGLAQTEVRLADIPRVSYRPAGNRSARPLRRTADLLQMLWAGHGTFTGSPTGNRGVPVGVSLHRVAWRAPEAAGLTVRSFGGAAEEATLSLHLWSGASWCTPPLELLPESRLRLDAIAVGPEASARLRVAWLPSTGSRSETTHNAGQPGDPVVRALDLPLPRGQGRLCLEAEQGAVSVGEPRILAPEPEGSDERPRWIVLTICDALRGDILSQAGADRLAPALVGLARRGQRYDQAISPGAHTQAAVWPLLTGRDLARLDPARARRFNQMGTPLDLVYTRGNIPLSHLAQAAGYHPVFLGNNSFLLGAPLFARLSNRGKPDTGTVDTIASLEATLSRYADERVFLLYYLSTPHNFSHTPRRLFERLGCGSLSGMAAERCAYDARIAHADEAIEALQQGLAHHGLDASTLQLLTADHGEVFGDGRNVETELFGKWYNLSYGHGGATHANEIRVPLIVAGKGVSPGAWSGRVSTLDVLPTLASIGGFPMPQKLDGRVLPLSNGSRAEPPLVVSQGFCTHSVLAGKDQLVWWEAECARRRELGSARPVTQRAELWRNGVLEATDESDPDRIAPLVRRHLEWLAARLPGEAWLLDASGLGAALVRVTAAEGRIVDWGPSSGPAGLNAVDARLDADGRGLRLDFRGDPGLFFVSTWPKAAPVRFDIEADGRSLPATFVGPLQLPLALAGQVVDPSERPGLWLAAAEPARQVSTGPHLRVWRQAYHQGRAAGESRTLSELDRVLREWGYIR